MRAPCPHARPARSGDVTGMSNIADLATNAAEYSVSELSGALKRTVEDSFGHVRVRGEISGYRGPHSSGHAYFALKDEKARLEAVVWRTAFAKLAFKPEEGLEVVATGRLTTYPGSSKYQIVIEDLKPAGAGALMALLNERRLKLEGEGLFSTERKRPLPYMPRTIGIVTSPTGAVIRDICHRIEDRFPVHLLVWPVRVQGETSGAEVAAAIEGFNALPADGPIPRPDLLIVARGGGSLEDLWGFNDEAVVRAAAASAIPLISAVGHETDWTLLDHVADRRAPTPTGAAELAVPVRAELVAALAACHARHGSAVSRRLVNERARTQALARALPSPDMLLALPRRRLDEATLCLDRAIRAAATDRRHGMERLAGGLQIGRLDALVSAKRSELRHAELVAAQSLSAIVAVKRQRLTRATSGLHPQTIAGRNREARRDLLFLEGRLLAAMDRASAGRRERLSTAMRVAASFDPKTVLERGYAIVRDGDGTPITRAEGLVPGRAFEIEFAGGQKRPAIAGRGSLASAPGRPKAGRTEAAAQDDLFLDS